METVVQQKKHSNELGDFTTTPRLLCVSALAIAIGVLSAFVALGLLKLIGFFTNIFFYQRVSSELVSPLGHHLGVVVIAVPVVVVAYAFTVLTMKRSILTEK